MPKKKDDKKRTRETITAVRPKTDANVVKDDSMSPKKRRPPKVQVAITELKTVDESTNPDDFILDDDDDTITRQEVRAMLAALEQRLTATIAQNVGKAVTVDKLDEPPLPPKTGKRFQGAKGDIRVRVDINLMKLFEADVQSRFAGNASRAMDAILWSYYGKPKLSFEPGEE